MDEGDILAGNLPSRYGACGCRNRELDALHVSCELPKLCSNMQYPNLEHQEWKVRPPWLQQRKREDNDGSKLNGKYT